MLKYKQYYFYYLLEILILTIITSIFCFKFSIAYNEMDIFPYAKATFSNGLSPGWHLNFKFPSNFLFNYTLGFFMSKYDPFLIIILGRILSYIFISYSYIYLSRILKLNFFTSSLTYIIFLYFFKNGIGDAGEWIVGGLEAKVFAYSLCIFSLSSFLKDNHKRGFLFAGLSLSMHLLVGVYNLFCLIPLLLSCLKQKKIEFINLLQGISYFMIAGIIGISEIINSLFLNTSQIIQEKGWDIYVNIRVPHHVIPDFSSNTWIKLIILTLVTLLFLKSKHHTKRLVALYSLSSIIIIVIGFVIYYFLESHYMRYYFFRFSDVILPFLTLVLIATLHHRIKYIYLLLISIIIIPNIIKKDSLSEFLSSKSYNINSIKAKTNQLHRKQESSQDTKISEWIIQNTNNSDQFIVPPDNLYFCISTEREIFVSWWMLPSQYDYKSVENLPSDMIEWYDRLKLLNQKKDFNTLKEVNLNYITLNRQSILDIQNTYRNIKYILMPSDVELEFPIAIKTNTHVLYYIY